MDDMLDVFLIFISSWNMIGWPIYLVTVRQKYNLSTRFVAMASGAGVGVGLFIFSLVFDNGLLVASIISAPSAILATLVIKAILVMNITDDANDNETITSPNVGILNEIPVKSIIPFVPVGLIAVVSGTIIVTLGAPYSEFIEIVGFIPFISGLVLLFYGLFIDPLSPLKRGHRRMRKK